MKREETLHQLSKYFVSGGMGLISYLFLLYVCTEFLQIHHLLSFIIAATIGVLINFIISKRFVFKSTKNVKQEIYKFFTVATTGCVIQFALVYVFVEKLKVPYIIANVIAAGLVFFFTFTFNKLFTFGKTSLTSTVHE